VVLAVRRGDVIGFAAAKGDLLEALYVLPSDVGAGLGTALLDAIGPVARLWVLSENQSGRAFYERRGWRWGGVAQGAADGEGQGASGPVGLSHSGPGPGDRSGESGPIGVSSKTGCCPASAMKLPTLGCPHGTDRDRGDTFSSLAWELRS
jgi:hypothetical protein